MYSNQYPDFESFQFFDWISHRVHTNLQQPKTKINIII